MQLLFLFLCCYLRRYIIIIPTIDSLILDGGSLPVYRSTLLWYVATATLRTLGCRCVPFCYFLPNVNSYVCSAVYDAGDRFGWRRCTEVEKAALLGHFAFMGERMGIKGVRNWKTWDDANAFQKAYEVRLGRGGDGGGERVSKSTRSYPMIHH